MEGLRVMRGTLFQFPKSVRGFAEIDLLMIDGFHQPVDFPETSEIDLAHFRPFDVDELVHLVLFPERAGEGRRADEKTPVDGEHRAHVGEMPLDPFAAGPAFLQGTAQLDHEAGAFTKIFGTE